MALKNIAAQNFLLSNRFTPPTSASFPAKVYCKKSEGIESYTTKKTLPPGPVKLPLIGNLYNLVGSLPHHALRDLADQHGPLMHLQLGEISAVVVSSPQMAQEIMKTHDVNFAQRPELLAPKIVSYDHTDIAFSPYGEYWKQMRRICITELLGTKRVQSFSSLREEEASKMIESIRRSAGSPIDLTEKIFTLTSGITCIAAFGSTCKDQDALIELTKEGIALNSGFDLGDLFPSMEFLSLISGIRQRLETIHKDADMIMNRIINERKQLRKSNQGEQVKEDLLDVLLRVQGSGNLECPITEDNIKAVIWDLFAAGTDTSSTTVDWAMAEMIRNPRIFKKAQAEVRKALKGKETITEADIQDLKYLKVVIKESLRLHPPAPLLLPRESREKCEIGGYEIPVKTKVIVNAWAIMRDNKYWPNAEKFIPERFSEDTNDYKGANFEYIPFGAGRRICPGVSFGLANIELPLALLLYHFNWSLPKGVTAENLDMTEAFGATVGRKNHLHLIPTPYIPSLDNDDDDDEESSPVTGAREGLSKCPFL